MIPIDKEVLFTRQRHQADRAGLHYDVRFVVGDKAYSFATKKDLPEPGRAILFHEQPVHTAHYALTPHITIPKGEYGAGTTTLDFARKVKLEEGSTPEKLVFTTRGTRYLLKKTDGKYGDKAWLFKNLGTSSTEKRAYYNRYLDVVATTLIKSAMFERAKYTEPGKSGWESVPDPAGTYKYDGASFYLIVNKDGSLKYLSRRPSVRGGFPDRTASLPYITQKTLPELAGNVYNVELIHTGHDPYAKESHPAVSGILNSLPDRAIATQKLTGPVRAIVHNVVEPKLSTYSDKLSAMKQLEDAYGDQEVLRSIEPHIGVERIRSLVESTKQGKREGIIVTSLTRGEDKNPRVKVKHQDYYNLEVVGFQEELDKNGSPKNSLGSLVVADSGGNIVANVGTGFTPAMRREIWDNKKSWLGRLVQVKTMGLAQKRLRAPVYNGEADGSIDSVL